jgi:SHS2 domain-containing protein
MESRFEEVEHTADIAIRVRGDDLAELFANAAYGMACQMANPGTVDRTTERLIDLEAYDAETLLVTWLGELLYLGEQDGSVFVDFDVHQVTPTHLRATARGGPAHEWRGHIKAATFSGLEIVHTDAGADKAPSEWRHPYEATIVFDA